jgi:hypothetical protein
MAKGRVAGVGRHEALLESCREYAALVRRQLTAQQDDLDAVHPSPGVDAAVDPTSSQPTSDGASEPAAGRATQPSVGFVRTDTDSSDGY